MVIVMNEAAAAWEDDTYEPPAVFKVISVDVAFFPQKHVQRQCFDQHLLDRSLEHVKVDAVYMAVGLEREVCLPVPINLPPIGKIQFPVAMRKESSHSAGKAARRELDI